MLLMGRCPAPNDLSSVDLIAKSQMGHRTLEFVKAINDADTKTTLINAVSWFLRLVECMLTQSLQ